MTKLEKINELLGSMKLCQAITSLQTWAKALSEHGAMSEIENLEETYRYLLRYFLLDVEDKERSQMVDDLKRKIALMALRLSRSEEKREAPGLYFNALRNAEYAHRTLSPLLGEYHDKLAYTLLAGDDIYDENTHREMERILADIFTLLWVSFPLSKSDLQLVRQTIANPAEPLTLSSQMISALMLGSLTYYDPAVMRMFIELYLGEDTPLAVKARLLVAIVLIHTSKADQISTWIKDSKEDLKLLSLASDFLPRLKSVVRAVIATCETKEIVDQMRNEIMPAFSKLQPDIMKRFKDIAKDADLADPEMFDPEMNPEWADIMEKSGLHDKLRELAERQSRGADVMMPAFSNLKQFPFFNNIDAWFLPFDPMHSQLTVMRSLLGTPAGDMLTKSDMMCDSDRYSFALSLERIPEAQKQMMLTQMQAQYDQMQEDLATEMLRPSDFNTEVVNYVRDLYRFFSLFRLAKEFANPFEKAASISRKFFVEEAIGRDRAFYNAVGDELMRMKLYKPAANAFMYVMPHPDSNDWEQQDLHIMEKFAYCCQKLGEYKAAYEWYSMANSLGASSNWLSRKLALTARLSGHYKHAVVSYRVALEKDPENITLLINLAHSLMGSGQYEEAIKVYYQVSYLRQGNMNAMRGIAWCRVMLKDFKKARSAYEEILTSDPSASDYLNMGHLALIEGKFGQAQAMYQQSIRSLEGGLKEFESLFKSDYETLTEKFEVNPLNISLLMDSLR